jgi:hypothetical protein
MDTESTRNMTAEDLEAMAEINEALAEIGKQKAHLADLMIAYFLRHSDVDSTMQALVKAGLFDVGTASIVGAEVMT